MEEEAVFELASLFDGDLTLTGVALGALAIFVLVIAVRMVREKKSLLEVLGVRNGYVQEKVFLGSMSRMEELIREKAEAEGKRMDKHSQEIGDLRDAVQCLDRKVEKVSTKVEMMEQYKRD